MSTPTRWSPFEDIFNFQRDVDRFFNQFWSELPARTAATPGPSFQVNATDDGWRVDVPIPGIDPKDIALEVAGNTLSIRANVTGGENGRPANYEQTLTVPEFLDLNKVAATHRHGMLRLTLPLKESVKPRRIQIDTQSEEQRQLTGVK